MSSGGTSSKLHYDADHNLHCMITGRKDVIMVDSKYKGRLEMEVCYVTIILSLSTSTVFKLNIVT